MRARKRFGQHFLEQAWVDKLVAAIDVSAGDVLVEIGPGRGALTLALARTGAHVIAIEIDRDLAAALRAAAPPNVEIVLADVLETDLRDLLHRARPPASTAGVRVVGNLPYYITSPILFRLFELHDEGRLIRDAILMLQREVADRLVAGAGSGEYGVLSIFCQLHADVVRLFVVPPGAFRPPPKVTSAVVQLRFRAPAVSTSDRRLFAQLVRTIFTRRRKTVLNALKPFARRYEVSAAAALRETGIEPARRPETLQLSELATLADVFASIRNRAVL